MRAEEEPITLKIKACRRVCRRQSVMMERRNLVVCRLMSSAQETQRHNSENEQIRTLLERQREQILADFQAEIRKHEFQADYDRRSTQKLNETIESQKEEISRAHQGDERRRQDQQLLHEQLLKQTWDLREAHERSLNEMEELKRFQGSTFDTIARRKLVEDRDTILEFTAKVQELQDEINCMNDSRDFQDAESVRSGHSHVTSQPVFFLPHPVPGGMLSRRNAEPQRRAAKHLGHTWYIGKRFCKSSRVFFSTFSAGIEFTGFPLFRTNPHPQAGKNGNQTPVQDQRCQSGPSAKSSVILSAGDSSKNYGADPQPLQISDLYFDKFPTPSTVACWKIRFKTEVCACSQFPTEALLWIKEVEMVKSVDGLKSSLSVRGIRMPDFEVLDAKIASALSRIIHNSHFKRTVSLEEQEAQKQDRFLRGRQIAYLIYEYFLVIGSHDSVENYTDLFTVVLRNDGIQEFNSKWDEILLSMTQIPSDDILEIMYKLRIRKSEKLKTVLELYNMEIHQKKAGPD